MPLRDVNPDRYQELLDLKAERIRSQFAGFSPPELQVFDSPPLHFRQRAEFRVWHQDNDSFCVMFPQDSTKTPVRIDEFPIGSELLEATRHAIMERVRRSDILRSRLFQIEFLSTLSGEVLVSLIYHRRLDDSWVAAAEQLQRDLNIKIIGRSRKQKLVLQDDFVEERLRVAGNDYYYQQIENSFTQPNARVNEKMLQWAKLHTENSRGDLLELYCGNGNFTTVLASNFKRVLATEIAKTSVKSALYNFSRNGVDNVTIARMSSEELTAALNGEREFRRLRDINLKDYDFSTLLVDPPRAGLDPDTEALASRFTTIIYISCNPNTLYNNLLTLCDTHRIDQFAIFDQFPYTDHIECGVKLVRKLPFNS